MARSWSWGDNLNIYVSAAMTNLIAARDWLTVYQLSSSPMPTNSTRWNGCGHTLNKSRAGLRRGIGHQPCSDLSSAVARYSFLDMAASSSRVRLSKARSS